MPRSPKRGRGIMNAKCPLGLAFQDELVIFMEGGEHWRYRGEKLESKRVLNKWEIETWELEFRPLLCRMTSLEQYYRLRMRLRCRISGSRLDSWIRVFILTRSSRDLWILTFEKLWFGKYSQGNGWKWKEIGTRREGTRKDKDGF